MFQKVWLVVLLAICPVTQAQAQEAWQQRTLLSDILPHRVAALIEGTDLDVPLGELSKKARMVLEGKADMTGGIAREIFCGERCDGSGNCRTPEGCSMQVTIMPFSVRAGDAVAVTELQVSNSNGEELVLPPGSTVPHGYDVIAGMVINVGLTDMFVTTVDDGGEQLQLISPPRGGVMCGCADNCTVTCAGNYYACCSVVGTNCARCVCVANSNTEANCDSGGPGAVDCSTSSHGD